MAENGIESRLTPYTPWISPDAAVSRLPFSSTSVFWPLKPRNAAVCTLFVCPPITLVTSVWPPLEFADTYCSSSATFCAPVRSISSRVMTCTGSAPSPSTRRMFEPVTSMRMSCAIAGSAPPATASAIAAASGRRVGLSIAAQGTRRAGTTDAFIRNFPRDALREVVVDGAHADGIARASPRRKPRKRLGSSQWRVGEPQMCGGEPSSNCCEKTRYVRARHELEPRARPRCTIGTVALHGRGQGGRVPKRGGIRGDWGSPIENAPAPGTRRSVQQHAGRRNRQSAGGSNRGARRAPRDANCTLRRLPVARARDSRYVGGVVDACICNDCAEKFTGLGGPGRAARHDRCRRAVRCRRGSGEASWLRP